MKKYAAKHHVGLGSYTARPGELIEIPLEESQVRWLLGCGAIEAVEFPEEFEPEKDKDGPEPGEEEDAFGDEETEEEDAPPEIDVMDGISGAGEKRSRKNKKGESER